MEHDADDGIGELVKELLRNLVLQINTLMYLSKFPAEKIVKDVNTFRYSYIWEISCNNTYTFTLNFNKSLFYGVVESANTACMGKSSIVNIKYSEIFLDIVREDVYLHLYTHYDINAVNPLREPLILVNPVPKDIEDSAPSYLRVSPALSEPIYHYPPTDYVSILFFILNPSAEKLVYEYVVENLKINDMLKDFIDHVREQLDVLRTVTRNNNIPSTLSMKKDITRGIYSVTITVPPHNKIYKIRFTRYLRIHEPAGADTLSIVKHLEKYSMRFNINICDISMWYSYNLNMPSILKTGVSRIIKTLGVEKELPALLPMTSHISRGLLASLYGLLAESNEE